MANEISSFKTSFSALIFPILINPERFCKTKAAIVTGVRSGSGLPRHIGTELCFPCPAPVAVPSTAAEVNSYIDTTADIDNPAYMNPSTRTKAQAGHR
jgi:hypothetical protein